MELGCYTEPLPREDRRLSEASTDLEGRDDVVGGSVVVVVPEVHAPHDPAHEELVHVEVHGDWGEDAQEEEQPREGHRFCCACGQRLHAGNQTLPLLPHAPDYTQPETEDAADHTSVNDWLLCSREEVLSQPCALPRASSSACPLSDNVQNIASSLQHQQVHHNGRLAQPVKKTCLFDIFFIYHEKDRLSVQVIVDNLEATGHQMRCLWDEKYFTADMSPAQRLLYGVTFSSKTVIMVSSDFVQENWDVTDIVISQLDDVTLSEVLVLLIINEAEVPDALSHVMREDTRVPGWWTRFLRHIPAIGAQSRKHNSNGKGFTRRNSQGLRNCHLLASVKSIWRPCCGQRLPDNDPPQDIRDHGIEVPVSEYVSAVQAVLCCRRARLHLACYHLPLLALLHVLVLALCLVLVPYVESHFRLVDTQLGLEVMHGALAWLSLLTLHVAAAYIARRKMKREMYECLAKANSIMSRYSLLLGLENLGLADCNRFYLHFFYYDIGPCLSHVQETLAEMTTTCPSTQADAVTSEHISVLSNGHISNISLQVQALGILLRHSGQYLNLLLRKKLTPPSQTRHVTVKSLPCLCQYAEGVS